MKLIHVLVTLFALLSLTFNANACDGGGNDGGDSNCSGANSSPIPGSTQQSANPNSSVGNPISVITGNKYQQEIDYEAAGGVASLLFKRHYNSLNIETDTGLGFGWRHSFDIKLVTNPKQNKIQINQSDGRRIIFTLDSVNTKQFRATSPQDGVISAIGNKILWSLNDGRSIFFLGSRPVEITYPGNRSFTLEYENIPDGHLSKVTDNNGRSLLFSYSKGNTALGNFEQNTNNNVKLPGHLESVTLPDGKVINYSYDDEHNLSSVTYPDNTKRIYHYENIGFPNHLTGITNRSGIRFATWGYTDEGRANLSTHADGAEKVTLEYKIPEQMGDIGTTIVTNSLEQKSTYTWRYYETISQRLLLSSEGPGCATCPAPNKNYIYNNDYQIESIIDTKTGNVLQYNYDKQGRISSIKQKSPQSGGVPTAAKESSNRLVVRYEYNGNLPHPTLIARPSVNPDGEHITAITYNDDQQPATLTEKGFSPTTDGSFDPIERRTKLDYTNGNLSTIDGPRDDVQDLIQLAYDQQNRLQSLTQANGQSIKVLSYDISGHPTQIQKGEQSPLHISYNAQGQPTDIKQRNRSVQYSYDIEGRLTQITSADGEVIRMAYDEAGRLNTLNDNKGRKIQQLHDSESRPTQTQLMGASGKVLNTISYLYDAQGRLDKTQTQNLDGETETDYQYDEKGQLVKVEKDDQAVELSYNGLGQLLGLTQPGEVVTQFNYDNKGQNTALTDARDNKTQTIKDDFGRTVQHISPDTGTNIYAYDASGNRIKRTDPENNITTYQWNAANQLVKKVSTSNNGEIEITTFDYDSKTGKLASTTNPSTTESFQYNNEGQLIAHTREIDTHTFTTGYEYNEQDKLHKKHLPDGQTLRYHYYAEGDVNNTNNKQTGQLKAITRESLLGIKQESIIAEIDNDKTDSKSGYLSYNGLKTEYTFREDGQLQNIQIADTLKLKYTYDQNGNITGIDENGTLQSFEYDQGRLTLADTLTGQYHYDYDKVGNRTAKAHQDIQSTFTSESYQYPENGEGNRLLSYSQESGNITKAYQYNKSGSPEKTNGFSYEYNANQRPIKVFKNSKSNKELIAEYQYNTFGERIKKVSYSGSQKTVTYFLYDGHTLTAEITEKEPISGGVSFNQYIYLKHQPVAKLENKQLYAIHSDHLGTPRVASNDKKQTVWKADYTPFGKAEVVVGTISLNLRFPGQYEDQETRTHYNYLRDYNPETGRYITSDPIGLKGGINTYAYVSNNPLFSSDILGLAPDETTITLDGVDKPIATAEYTDKLTFVLNVALEQAVGNVKQALLDMLKPENIAIMVTMMAGIAVLQAVPGLNLVVDAVLLGWGWWNFGSSGVNFLYSIIKTGVGIARASTRTELCNLGISFGNATSQFAESAIDIISGGSRRISKAATNNNVSVSDIRNLPNTPITNRPSGYSTLGNNIRGPNEGIYTKLNGTEYRGHQVYENSGKKYIFEDGKKVEVKLDASDVSRFVTGLVGEKRTTQAMEDAGWTPLGNTQKSSGTVDDDLPGYQGQNGIDGIFKRQKSDGTYEYVIVETKASTGGSTGSLNQTVDGDTQLSSKWIDDRLATSGLPQADQLAIKNALEDGTLKTVKAEVTGVQTQQTGGTDVATDNGTIIFKEVTRVGDQGATVTNTEWSP
ncbi:hypothetical protein GCM10009133_04190 [Cocleimonas flava]|uniref:RHS repeat-associated protein n=1 Tax=Cocleimonas flava TaxID=634765 RepID=A0A4R1F315_9GAMM|nr:RHS repeat-associated core domain-containing protein [Cocleimonas flava]TCJ86789.1 RHS repeat-associated protein [Cocleimonas flava]